MTRSSARLAAAFEAAGYDPSYGRAAVSNRPDLCEYQCNGALAAAKVYHKAPLAIANEVAAQLDTAIFTQAEAVAPGFLNLRLSPDYLCTWLEQMRADAHLGAAQQNPPQTIVVDYGGANVAKPLHVGHIRPAIIGEAICRMERYLGNKVIGDVHLGDWGLQMGLIVEGVRDRAAGAALLRPGLHRRVSRRGRPSPSTTWRRFTPRPAPGARWTPPSPPRAHEATLRLQQGDARLPRPLPADYARLRGRPEEELRRRWTSTSTLWKGESDARALYPGP